MMLDISSPQFQDAIECARPQWLKKLVAEILPQLIPLTNSDRDMEKAKMFDSFIKEKFAKRGLTEPTQQKNRITDVRNAIKVFDPDHPALDVVGFSSDEWTAINSQALKRANRSTQFLHHPDEIVLKAAALLQSSHWAEIAAGLSVITGRRVLEILQTASFELVSHYSVLFSGAVKRRDESVPLQFEIPTLVEASLIIDAISRLRQLLAIQDLTPREVNDKYEFVVSAACNKYFNDLVPAREGKNNLYTHLMRAVYVTIASHWFCPPTVSDLEFRAHIQGHFQVLNEQDATKQTNMASQRHYWDYKISDGKGNIDGRLGIRLDEDNVEIIKAFTPQPQEIATSENLGSLVKITVWESDRSALADIQDKFNLGTRADANHHVLTLARSVIDAAQKLDISPEALIEKLDSSDTAFPSEISADVKEDDQNDEDNSTSSAVEENVSESVPPSQLLFEKMDQQLDQMSQQQISLDNMTRAIGDLVRVFANNPSSASPLQVTQPQSLSSSPTKSNKVKSTKQTSKPQSELSERKLHSIQTRQKVNQYIDAIMAFNDVLDRPHGEKWAVSVAGLIRLVGCGQHPVYAVYNSRKPEIEAHHLKHQLSSTHNKKDKSFPPIESVISL